MTEGEINPEAPVHDLARRNEWLRREGPNHGIDPEKFFLGETLDTVLVRILDDRNCFSWHRPQDDLENPERFPSEAPGARMDYLGRLDGEIDTLDREINIVAPLSEISAELKGIREDVRLADWTVRDQFSSAYGRWQKLSDRVGEIIKENPELQEASEYYINNMDKIAKLYSASSGQTED
ncbi:MAG: hypothetical protein PHE48_02515 [Candidatus Daviesbacteria bacterium]|nr:hypothetical protein [Candidatus Daviesbacteria bacterium]